jgi:drug/metabolite transporter (DMT)-like permease
VALGGILGMGLGGLLYIAAVQDAGAGKAAILSATSPLFALPLAMLFLAERVTPRLMAGTLVSIVGISLVV